MSKDKEIEVLRKKLDRERLARQVVEKLLEDKSRELYGKQIQIENLNRELEQDLKGKELELYNLSKFPEENPNPVLRINESLELMYANLPASFVVERIGKDKELNQLFRFKIEESIIANEPVEFELEIDEEIFMANAVPLLEKHYVNVYMSNVTKSKKAQQLLKVAKDKAEENVAVKNNFLSNMSHEIRTPMNAIIGMADLLKKFDMPSKASEYVSHIDTASNNLLSIINDILDFSKLEAGKLDLVLTDFNLTEHLNNVFETIKHRKGEKRIELINKVSNDPLLVNGDAVRFSQIVVNLLSNAIKFTEVGTVEMDLDIIKSNGNIDLTLKVKDTGVGISEDKLGTIFERFRQEEESTIRQFGGTGLGLSIVKELVNLMGGTLSVYSEKGMGTTFEVKLTLKEVSSLNKASSIEKSIDLSGKHFLVVDDYELNRVLLAAILEECNATFDEAENGLDAVALVKDNKYDLILMDVQMPIMDGLQACREIKDMGVVSPIVALTANAVSGQKELYLRKGMDAYLSKPIEKNTFYTLLGSILEIDVKTKEVELINTDIEDFSKDKLLSVCGQDNGLVHKMVHIFLEKTPANVEDLFVEFSNENINRVGALIHKMKPSFNYMGAKELHFLAQKIEKTIKSTGGSYLALTDDLWEFKIRVERLVSILKSEFPNWDK